MLLNFIVKSSEAFHETSEPETLLSCGVISACAVKSLGGGMLGRLAPQDAQEKDHVLVAGLNLKEIISSDELVTSRE